MGFRPHVRMVFQKEYKIQVEENRGCVFGFAFLISSYGPALPSETHIAATNQVHGLDPR